MHAYWVHDLQMQGRKLNLESVRVYLLGFQRRFSTPSILAYTAKNPAHFDHFSLPPGASRLQPLFNLMTRMTLTDVTRYRFWTTCCRLEDFTSRLTRYSHRIHVNCLTRNDFAHLNSTNTARFEAYFVLNWRALALKINKRTAVRFTWRLRRDAIGPERLNVRECNVVCRWWCCQM